MHGTGHRSSQGRIQLGSDAEVGSAQQAALEKILSKPGILSSAGDLSSAPTAQSIRCKTGQLQQNYAPDVLFTCISPHQVHSGMKCQPAVVCSDDHAHCGNRCSDQHRSMVPDCEAHGLGLLALLLGLLQQPWLSEAARQNALHALAHLVAAVPAASRDACAPIMMSGEACPCS